MVKGADYEELQEKYILFICPNDIFHKEKAIYKFQNREECDPNILLGDLCCKNFYIFKKYSEMDDKATREYMQYFATKKCESEKMKRIHELVEKYRMDPAARKAYMTLEQELNIRCKKLIKEEKQRIAKALVAQGKLTVSEIAEISGLSPEEIKAL
ncbi:MAG: hypothetical protein MJZ05_08615 [Fibrobacter sp.]|nr:hypothetical protein [Fibrobacter sp.]